MSSLIISTVLYSCDENSLIQSRLANSAIAIWDQNISKNLDKLPAEYTEEKHTNVDSDIIELKNNFQMVDYGSMTKDVGSLVVEHDQSKVKKNQKRKKKKHHGWKKAYGE